MQKKELESPDKNVPVTSLERSVGSGDKGEAFKGLRVQGTQIERWRAEKTGELGRKGQGLRSPSERRSPRKPVR